MTFIEQIINIVGVNNFRQNESMKKHTTFRVGGIAKFLVTPTSIDDIINVINCCNNNDIKYFILGNGSNVLVRDCGIDGMVIKIASKFSLINVCENILEVASGTSLGTIAMTALKHGLGGFEFASGIPGTLGGAIIMNAGAYGREMKDVVVESTVLTTDGKIMLLSKDAHQFGYRSSALQNGKYIVLGTKLKLYYDDCKNIAKTMDELKKQRREKQPLDKPNAGSTFKRPDGYFAAQLIDMANLKGYSIGGAKVSTKHAGFIINTGNATATDILMLMEHIRNTVEQKFGVRLEPEIKII